MYLSQIDIKNFRGIKSLTATFNDKINVIVGENGSCKSALIDAIRILYNFGNLRKDIYVENKDFHINLENRVIEPVIKISYEFRGLNEAQKGAFYEFLVISPEEDYVKVSLEFEYRENKNPIIDYSTGAIAGQKAEYKAFELFQHYYLDALRDSTKDLLNSKNSILGNLVMRLVNKNKSKGNYEDIISDANEKLLKQSEVVTARNSVNKNLANIFKTNVENEIGLRINDVKAENFINTLKPFLPFKESDVDGKGLELYQNSLGYNNLVYIATVLGDITYRVEEEKNTHFVLLIEEPEAHLHPQLQLNLFNFIKDNIKNNTQIFVTTHSPTLTSKIDLENLILLDKLSIKIDSCFQNREGENIIEDTAKGQPTDYQNRKKQLERYIDVTKSQLFFAKSILFIEGISEELLIPAMSKIMALDLQDYRIELINVGGTSFYPFLYLFNSINPKVKIDKKVAILTDDDRFPSSKDTQFSFSNLIANNYENLDELYEKIINSTTNNRLLNLNSVRNGSSNILVQSSYKTFEFEIAKANTSNKKSEITQNLFFVYLQTVENEKIEKVITYYKDFNEDLSEEQRIKVAMLLWKIITSKADFAQDFSIYILNNISLAKNNFVTPIYITNAITHLTQSNHD